MKAYAGKTKTKRMEAFTVAKEYALSMALSAFSNAIVGHYMMLVPGRACFESNDLKSINYLNAILFTVCVLEPIETDDDVESVNAILERQPEPLQSGLRVGVRYLDAEHSFSEYGMVSYY